MEYYIAIDIAIDIAFDVAIDIAIVVGKERKERKGNIITRVLLCVVPRRSSLAPAAWVSRS